MQEGLVTNNGTNNVTFAVGETDQTATPGTGFYANGSSSPNPYAAFGTQFLQTTPLANTPATPASYTVQDGDTLESIAQAMWGDSSLWYKIADANGISDDSDLTVGESLTIPTDVSTVDNNSTTNTVYNTAQAIGNTSPTHPKPPSHHGGCGVFGEIIEAVIAIVITVLLPPVGGPIGAALEAAGANLAAQGIGEALGIQSKINWTAVAEAGISAGVDAGLSDVGAFTGLSDLGFPGLVLQGAIENAATQGIEVATGLKKSFNWADVAASGISNGVIGEVSQSLQGSSLGSTAIKFVSGMAGDVAYAATRSLINGSDFGDNLIQGLPNVIGQTIGNAVANSQTPQSDADVPPGMRDVNGVAVPVTTEDSDSLMDQIRNSNANAWQQIANQPLVPMTISPNDLISTMPSLDLGASGSAAASSLGLQVADSGEFVSDAPLISSSGNQTNVATPQYLVSDGEGHYYDPSNVSAGHLFVLDASGNYVPYVEEVTVTGSQTLGVTTDSLDLGSTFAPLANFISASLGQTRQSSVSRQQGASPPSDNRWSLGGLKRLVCEAIPSGIVIGGSGSYGGIGSVVGGGEAVINFNSGQVSLFAYGGLQAGWNNLAQAGVYGGPVYGLQNDNANYAGGFSSVNLGYEGLGVSHSWSSQGLNLSSPAPADPVSVFTGGVSVGPELVDGVPTFTYGRTGYTAPLQIPPLVTQTVFYSLPPPIQVGVGSVLLARAICND